VSRRRKQAILAPRKQKVSDDEWADAIVNDLRRHSHLRIEESEAKKFTKNFIKKVRVTVRSYLAEPRPSDAIKTIKTLADHARSLSSGMNEFSDNLHYKLSFVFLDTKSCPRRPQWVEEQRSKLQEWMADLEKIAKSLEQMEKTDRRHFQHEPKISCAFSAAQLIDALSPAMELRKGRASKFYSIAETLWEAVSGHRESMKNACDRLVDACQRDKTRIKGGYLLEQFFRPKTNQEVKTLAVRKG
jgi:Asp-tRNA(Asn)/Glu-tRNA(Gln) amidotransferase C subunit